MGHRPRSLLRSLVALALALAVLAPRPALAGDIIHIVQPGENLFRIGLRYGVGWQAIVTANGLSSTNIYVGQSLIIPGAGGTTTTNTPPPTPPPNTGAGTYVVQRGDTLWRIAQAHGVTVAALMARNGLANPNVIYAGQVLVISGSAQAPAADPGKRLYLTGYNQALSLSCESRSAADWAAYFGVAIDELTFLSQLPSSDDPDTGFVGSAYGARGQIPPASYGVHAGPVAALLQAYGLAARAVTGLTWDHLRAEIDAGRPVIAWVVADLGYGTAVQYTAASNGHTTLVVPYEHTVIVIGYNATSVIVLDGALVYSRSQTQFLASWGVLGNMAVVAQ